MPMTRARSPSPDRQNTVKRLKSFHPANGAADPTPCFASGLFDEHNIHLLKKNYLSAAPFKHALVSKLFQDDLLTKVKDECLSELSFVEKETDIYKVHQTGDLASLSFLTDVQISRLQNLRALRDALYSKTFRSWIMSVTGCGPLSGIKTDMSVTTYRKGCHLLNHDDVIGTRRVSYILYMPLPQIQGWQKDWGGALELYPVSRNEKGVEEPDPIPAKSIAPSWNQFVLFEVQPGRSFHCVEEVVVGEGEDGRERLSISGWFHAAQPEEEGYEPEVPVPEGKSSLEQLTSSSTEFNDYSDSDEPPLPDVPISEEHLTFLSKYLSPVYLHVKTLKALAARFADESSLELHSFLSDSLASKIDSGLRERDARDGLGKSRHGHVPSHTAGTDAVWKVRGPPHKSRFCVLEPGSAPKSPRSIASTFAGTNPPPLYDFSDAVIRKLQDELFPSAAFRAWLAHVSSLVPMRYAAEARRFRPGLDYTLAVSEEKEARLDVVLDLTPNAASDASVKNGKMKKVVDDGYGWETGKWGGWECYMAPHEGEEDPAVYRSGASKKDAEANGNGRTNGVAHHDNDGIASTSQGYPLSESAGDEEDTMVDGDEPMEEDGTLLTVQPGFNRLLLVLRDEGVMHFVKYVSASAEGSRWDICGEYEVGMIAEAED